jgi:hypothetical protein
MSRRDTRYGIENAWRMLGIPHQPDLATSLGIMETTKILEEQREKLPPNSRQAVTFTFCGEWAFVLDFDHRVAHAYHASVVKEWAAKLEGK